MSTPGGALASRAVAVAIATRCRPEGLQRLLTALDEQELSVRLIVCIADNDPQGTARPVADLAAQRLEVRYVIEPRPGIPFARNASLRLAEDADLVAFVDDDEIVPARWIATLLETLDSTDADIVTAPVVAALPPGAPPWAAAGAWFERRRLPTGTFVETAATGNTMVRAEVLRAMGADPFDVALATTGGSDADLFRRAIARGHRIVWCDDAPAYESVPAARLTRGWVVRRQLREGNGRGRQLVQDGRDGRAVVEGVWVMLSGGQRSLQCLARGRPAGRPGWGRILYGLGLLVAALGVQLNEYQGRFVTWHRPMRRPPEA